MGSNDDLRKLAEAHLSDGHVKYDTGQCEVCRSSRAILALLDRVERLERLVDTVVAWRKAPWLVEGSSAAWCGALARMERAIDEHIAALEVDRG